ncbi:MAG: serine protein kinase PrkA, partial [Nannocystaceae bacterium]
DPGRHTRGAAQYIRDAFDAYGRRDVHIPSGKITRYRLFDCQFDDGHRLVGQEVAQNAFYEALNRFVQVGRINKLLLLHGPNGSAKTTFLEAISRSLEAYSHTPEGVLYRFSWVFPTRANRSGGIGFEPRQMRMPEAASFAHLQADDLDARVTDECKDPPLFLIPLAQRNKLLENLEKEHPSLHLCATSRSGQLSDRNRRIFDALLNGYRGDLKKVYQHVQVERLFLSRNYRQGLVTVEPKQTVDARSFPVTGDKAFRSMPASVGGQVLFGCQGDLVDANRGLLNFSDLLKRPYEHYKYLLTATESGQIALDHVVLNLDVVLSGSANDLDLLRFRELHSGEYQSLRARLELIPVCYLLDYRVERKVYQEQVGDVLRDIHIAPHVHRILALWGVMTRLRQPDPGKYNEKLKSVLEELTPLQKADLYAYGNVPEGLTSKEARELLALVPALGKEHFSPAVIRTQTSKQPHVLGDYEGSFGASVRDLKRVLLAAASDAGTSCITVPRLFRELRRYLADAVNHPWMNLSRAGKGFHHLDGEGSITEAAWNRWLDLSDREVRRAMGLVDEARYLDLFRKYVIHVSHHVKRERLFDEVTGKLTDPDQKFMGDLEKTMDPKAGPTFRQDVLSRIGAWALSNPEGEPDYAQIFSDYFSRLREDYYRQQKETVRAGINHILELLTDQKRDSAANLAAHEEQLARHALEVLLGQHDEPDANIERHTVESLRETLVQLSRSRY